MNTNNTNIQSSANNEINCGTHQKPNVRKTKLEAIEALKTLRRFISPAQLSTITDNMRGEEKQFFFDKAVEIADTINTMPQTYQQDGLGLNAIAYLHYFHGSYDWYITERDMEDEQLQAFGLVNMHEAEQGYINIEELKANGIEIDLYWTPKTLKQCLAR